MPTYLVISPGFFDGKYYSPDGKRKTLTTPTPFPKKEMPSWLGPLPKETKAVREKREEQERSQLEADKKKAESDAADIKDASFLGEGESANNDGVVNL